MREGEIVDGRFELERTIAEGGTGPIYRAYDRQNGTFVALKLLTRQRPRALDRFLQECIVLAEIHHPGVVRHVAHGRTPDGGAYLAMEWLDGQDLARFLRSAPTDAASTDAASTEAGSTEAASTETASIAGANPGTPLTPEETPTVAYDIAASLYVAGDTDSTPPAPNARLSVEQTVTIGIRLASVVGELHRRGIVHRDIKPSNVFLPGHAIEDLKVLDLGVAYRASPEIDDGVGETEAGLPVGTPFYMAPEQASAEGEITPATDVWAIGCVLFECLTGERPFVADSLMAVLARIIIAEPTPLRDLRPDVPADLVDLIARTMHKRPQDRPADAGVLAAMLARIDVTGQSQAVPARQPPSTSAQPAVLTESERRVTCVLLADRASFVDSVGGADDAAMMAAVAPSRCHLQRLADGTLLVTAPGTDVPPDQASRAARAALGLRDAFPALRMVLATGRTEGAHRLGTVVDAAARALSRVEAGAIRLDGLTAALLDTRFVLTRDAQGGFLHRERLYEGPRTLLGKQSPLVGREPELAALTELFDQCVEHQTARAALVIAPAGVGKTRLRNEFERRLQASGRHFHVIRGHGDIVSAGSPFGMIAPTLREMVGILCGEPLEARRVKLRARLAETVPSEQRERVTVFLGELAGVPFSAENNDSLTAARKDPMLMGQLMQAAWEDWLSAECARQPVLLVLDDLHWGDLPSISYIDHALQRVHDLPLMVLALARPEVSVAFPRLWEQHAVKTLHLAPLTATASAALVRDALGEQATPALVNALVARADGNAFYLEELIRSAADNDLDELPATVAGMVQARLDALAPEAKRILRAASVFGAIFWEGGVAALSGASGVFRLREWLDHLVACEMVSRQPRARIPGETEYRFRHALVRDAAYAMLTEEDRRLGHTLAGEWLEHIGERDSRMLAEHFIRGNQPKRAIPCFYRAAEQALEGNDLAAVLDLTERGVQADASGVDLGRLRTLQSVASYWQNDSAGGRRYGVEAASLLVPRSAQWFVAVGSAMVSSARLGDYDPVHTLLKEAMAAVCDPDAESEQLICLCRVTFQLLFNGYYECADEVLARIGALTETAARLDVLTYAQIHHLHSLRSALNGDIATTLQRLTTAIDAFERAGDMRNVALERTSLAWWWAELGFVAHAAKMCADNLAFCRRNNAQQAITFAKVNMGSILNHSGARAEARDLLNQAIAECREVGNARLEGWARANLAEIEYAAERYTCAERTAARAVELVATSPSLRAWALALHARALLALKRIEEAHAEAKQAMDIIEEHRGGLIHGRRMPRLVWALTLDAMGDRDGARDAIAEAAARVTSQARLLPRPEWRRRFLSKPENQLIKSLLKRWLEEPAPAVTTQRKVRNC